MVLPGRDEITPPMGGPAEAYRKVDAGRDIKLPGFLDAFANSQLSG